MFWSGETLTERLQADALVVPFRAERIDCAAYTLGVGQEVYVSPSDRAVDPEAVTIRRLEHGQSLSIPPGQFAFLLTEESVTVPNDSLGLISIRAKKKFRGLVNVSGFHVDPGYSGQLTFAVFNAGPVPVHLKRGDPIFLLWYAQLDRPTEMKKSGATMHGLDSHIIAGIAGELKSFSGLARRIEELEKELTMRLHKVERTQAGIRSVVMLVGGALMGLLLCKWCVGLATSRRREHGMVENRYTAEAHKG